jgi:hypothetical protein
MAFSLFNLESFVSCLLIDGGCVPPLLWTNLPHGNSRVGCELVFIIKAANNKIRRFFHLLRLDSVDS